MRDWLARQVAWRLPQRLVAWCAVRVLVYATTGPYSGTVAPELPAMDALPSWPV